MRQVGLANEVRFSFISAVPLPNMPKGEQSESDERSIGAEDCYVVCVVLENEWAVGTAFLGGNFQMFESLPSDK